LQFGGGIQCDVDHRTISDDGKIGALSSYGSLSDRNHKVITGEFFFNSGPAIEEFMFKKDHRIGIANGGFDQTFCIVCGRWT
jgi:hypothetical protein